MGAAARAPRVDAARPARALAIVPARLGSTRLARKMLLRQTGRYLFEHTVARAREAGAFERVLLATDSEEVLRAAREVDVEALLTSEHHASGTDRVHEALTLCAEQDYDVVVNLQGDEPEVPGQGLAALVAAFAEPAVELATLACPLADESQAADPNVVKTVLDARGNALYFSRAPIPARRDPRAPPAFLRHVGVYAFRPAALRAFCALPPGRLERIEGLEQLRWLEAGHAIRCLLTAAHPPGIDTAEHYAAFLSRHAQRSRSEEALS